MAGYTVGRGRPGGTGRAGSGRRWPKFALAVGYFGLLVGVLAARWRPATGYELSIYRATPIAFWVGLGVALAAAVAVASLAIVHPPGERGGTGRRVVQATLLLLASAVLAVMGLPVIRGYYSYGGGDALSHLGRIHAVAAGGGSPADFLYPGIHTIAVLVGGVGGSLTWATMLMVLAFFAAFLVFVPLCVRAILGSGPAVVVGTLSAALLLPIDNVSVHPIPHPSSQAILLLPFVLYVTFVYLADRDDAGSGLWPTPVGAVLALASTALVLVHPQQALNLLLLFVTVVGVGVLASRLRPGGALARHRRLYAQAGLLAVVFALWSIRFRRVRVAATGVVEGVLGSADVGNEIGQRSGSLGSIGGSIEELFVKLFLVGAVFAAVAAAFGLAVFLGLVDERRVDRPGLVVALAAGAVPVLGLFAAFFAASYTTQHFRYVGTLLAFATVLGGAGLAYGVDGLRARLPAPAVGSAVAVLFAVCLVLSVAAVHPSPYVYRSTPLITESRMTGHATAFEARAPGLEVGAVRGGSDRFADAVYGPGTPAAEAATDRPEGIQPPYFDNGSVREYYEEDGYLVVERADHLRELKLYDGFRYSERGFDALDATPGIDRVQANGELSVYLVDARPPNRTDAGRIVPRTTP